MEIKHIPGENKGYVMLYALSTCGWCKKTKKLLDELGVEYNFIDVDLLREEEKGEVKTSISEVNPNRSFPTIVINNNIVILGFDEDKIREELGK